MTPARHFALLPAAGVGARMGSGCPKQYLPLAGVPMLRRTLDVFRACPQVAHTFVVVSPDDGFASDVVPPDLPGVMVLRCGGATRKDSVQNGLQAMAAMVDADDWVLVHDAARPGLTPDLVARLLAAVGDGAVGGLLALPVVDTVKRAGPDGVRTVARDGLWLAQTPQMFRHALLLRALLAADPPGQVTDEASAVEMLGFSPLLVEGHACNMKVTLPNDIATVEMYLAHGCGG